tara:strand:- start:120 stop:737 length:618 start_codon:yes stop_codon:yes gene_type:complete
MKSNEMLNQIKTLLNIEVKLEDMKLENGTIVTAESFEKGKELFIVTDDEKVAMPVGEYILEDGRLLVVEEEGIIADVRDVSDEVPAKEEEETTEDLEEKEEVVEEEKEMAEVGDWEGMEKRIQNLEDAIADLKGDKESKMEDVQEEEMSDEIQAPLKSRTVKEEFEAASKPIKHNPEAVTEQKQVKFAKGRFNTTLDRVLNKLNK